MNLGCSENKGNTSCCEGGTVASDSWLFLYILITFSQGLLPPVVAFIHTSMRAIARRFELVEEIAGNVQPRLLGFRMATAQQQDCHLLLCPQRNKSTDQSPITSSRSRVCMFRSHKGGVRAISIGSDWQIWKRCSVVPARTLTASCWAHGVASTTNSYTTQSPGADWCLSPDLGGEAPGDHPWSPGWSPGASQFRSQFRGGRKGPQGATESHYHYLHYYSVVGSACDLISPL